MYIETGCGKRFFLIFNESLHSCFTRILVFFLICRHNFHRNIVDEILESAGEAEVSSITFIHMFGHDSCIVP